MRYFTTCTVSSCSADHCQSVPLCPSCLNGSVTVDNCGRNLARYCTMPRSCCNDLTFDGVSILVMAQTLVGSGARPLSVNRWPMNGTELSCNVTLSRFS